MHRWLFITVCLITALAVWGCGPHLVSIEKIMQQTVQPIVEDVLKETVAKATFTQAGGQGIEPGYAFDCQVIVGTVVSVHGELKAVGVSGQLMVSGYGEHDSTRKEEP